MNIEEWEILQFFDEPVSLPDVSYGLWAFRFATEEINIELQLNLVNKSAELIIESDIKQNIKVDEIDKIESQFDEFALVKKSGKTIRMKKEKPFVCHFEI